MSSFFSPLRAALRADPALAEQMMVTLYSATGDATSEMPCAPTSRGWERKGGGVCSLPAALKETKSDFLPDWIAHRSVIKDDKYGNTGVQTGQLERERWEGGRERERTIMMKTSSCSRKEERGLLEHV